MPQSAKIKALASHCIRYHIDRNGSLWAQQLYQMDGLALESWIAVDGMSRYSLYTWLGY